jgi:hypothetical protein
VRAEDHAAHGHHEKESCGCASADDGWTIDCSDMTPVATAFAHLADASCIDTCDERSQCMAAYRNVQAHHDHCPHGTLNVSSAVLFHAYADVCGEGCHIERQYDERLSQCPSVDCNSTSAMNLSLIALADNNCSNTCTGNCVAAFQQAVSFHDTCTEDQLLSGFETALHLHEEVCEDAICNTRNATFDANVCEDGHAEHDDLVDEHADEHEHHDEETCGCAAAADGWEIDCSDMAAVNDAFEHFKEDQCDDKCRTDGDGHCLALYRIIQTHHDHCPHKTFTAAMVADFHSYENGCGEGCVVARQFDSTLAQCPQVDCTSTSAMKAAVTEISQEICATECGTNSQCTAAFRKIVAFHDTCDHDDITFAVETALHEYEDVCTDILCNTASELFDANVCKEEDTGAAVDGGVVAGASAAVVAVLGMIAVISQ